MTALQRRLATLRSRTRAVLWLERVWPAIWPAVGVLGAGAVAALFDLPALLPPLLHWAVLLAGCAAIAGLAWRGLHRLRGPSVAEIDRRLELNGGVAHRPLTVLDDRPAVSGAESDALWQAHLRRAADQVARLRSGWPRQGLERVDQHALRGLLAVALAAGLVVAGPDAPGRLWRALTPGALAGPPAPEPLLQAWVTPPAYTGLPPLFLRPGDATVSVPAGSQLTASLTGGSGEPSLSLAGQDQPFHPLDATSWEAERDVGVGGPLVVSRRGRTQGSWTLVVVPDRPPVVAWASPPGNANQRRLQTRLPWTATDDYGVVSLQVELRLRDRAAADPLIVTIPLPGDAPKQAHGTQTQDLTANPWAGLPVIATLVGKDAPGQRGVSPEAAFTLPERSFKNPLARAVIDVRKRLALAPEDHAQEGADLAALADAPAAFDNNTSVFLLLSTTAALVSRSDAPADIAEAQQRLWTLALQLEDDAVSRTAQAVAAARQALRQANPTPPKPGQPSEMDRKAEALRQAIQKHLQALAEKAQRDGTLMPYDPHARTLNQHDFDKLTREMQQAARAGRMEEARDKMAQLERMLEQLKQAEANPGDRKQAQQQRQKGRQQMGAAEDMVQRETGLKQHAEQAPEAGQTGADQHKIDTAQQKAMRRALGEMMQQFGDLTGKVPDELSQADLAMRDAAGALAAGQDAAAATAEQRAIDALQKGEQQMSQQMANSLGISVQPGEGEGPPGDQMSQGDGDGNGEGDGTGMSQNDGDGTGEADADGTGGKPGDEPRDPLGRPTRDGASGRADGGNVHVPEEMERARTRDIQAELRRRGAERTRPAGELDYIDRLLKSY